MLKQCNLNQLEIGQKAKVKQIETEETIKRRLLDIGLIKDSIVECILKSPLGDPFAYSIRGTLIAIREEDASNILVEVLS